MLFESIGSFRYPRDMTEGSCQTKNRPNIFQNFIWILLNKREGKIPYFQPENITTKLLGLVLDKYAEEPSYMASSNQWIFMVSLKDLAHLCMGYLIDCQ